MKKTVIILLLSCLLLCSCNKETKLKPTDVLPQVMNSNEYLLYQNIFYNDMAKDYVGKEVTKTGIFTIVNDAYYDMTRYYIWGYYDNTKCCDWQWELKLDDTSKLPPCGSLVEVKGTLRKSDKALDGYWFDGVSINTKQEYIGNGCDVEMTTMSATLERVQLSRLQLHPEQFEGKTVSLYGRVYSAGSIQHPYYDSAWVQEFSTEGEVPAIGTEVIVCGTFSNGVVIDCTVETTTNY